MWWHFWAIMLAILFLSIAVLWCVVRCAMSCFYPQGTRGPKVRTFSEGTAKVMAGRPKGEEDRFIMKNGQLSWGGGHAPPREVYKA